MRDSQGSVAGVRFRNAGKIFYFHAAGMRLEPGEYVVVETSRGPEVAKVVIGPDQVVVNELGHEELKPILRLATEDDVRRADDLRQEALNLLPEVRRIAADAGFPSHIDEAEFTLDGRRLTLSFASEDRQDYRETARRISEQLKVKIEMRQMGARDRARAAGGYGICGRELCCSNWLTSFPSISIRMAKEQDLPLNPQKISGLCGRLLCCLSYEEEGYKEMRKELPKIGARCSTPTGEGKVIGVNILRRQVTLVVDGQRIEVGDRDLGTVVRWDTSSKSGDPPPSISRADAIAQGLIEATQQDLDEAAGLLPEPDWGSLDAPGRGRLPGGGPRKTGGGRPPRAATPPQQEAPAAREQGGRPQRGERPQQQQQPQQGRGGRPEQRRDEPQEPRESREQRQPRGMRGRGPGAPSSIPANAGEGRVFRRGGSQPAGEQPTERLQEAAPEERDRSDRFTWKPDDVVVIKQGDGGYGPPDPDPEFDDIEPASDEAAGTPGAPGGAQRSGRRRRGRRGGRGRGEQPGGSAQT